MFNVNDASEEVQEVFKEIVDILQLPIAEYSDGEVIDILTNYLAEIGVEI